ncbi:MAG TPA: efflux RND transporter periplasmic adaptor subunit [Pseudomonadales bacterium]|nr:efflux RND transporter periplasmic adaptor subunit [Pseudomonadales bacterium]
MNKRIILIGIAVAVIILVVLRMASRSKAQSPSNADSTMPVVAVARVAREDLFKQVTYPAEFRPYAEVVLHAKVSGYVDKMNVDFGDKVKAGELLATIEVPELQDELTNEIAAAQKAEADYTNADLIYARLVSVNKEHPNLVAQQDLDTAAAHDQMASAEIAEAKSDVGKYETLLNYTRITAPFDGVVTRRYADPGALIQGGTSSDTQSLPLVRVSDNYLLRLDFPVDVDVVQDIHVGDSVEVQVESLSGKTFTGTVSRFTCDVDDNTRKMTTEIEVPNPKLELDPGMYASVTLKVENHSKALAIPAEAVIAGENPSVFVVDANNKIEQRPVHLGMETPDKYEVLSGVQEGDLVVVGNHSEIANGQKVQPKIVELSMRDKN